jgi:hypothetical protein
MYKQNINIFIHDMWQNTPDDTGDYIEINTTCTSLLTNRQH